MQRITNAAAVLTRPEERTNIGRKHFNFPHISDFMGFQGQPVYNLQHASFNM